jgi:hypothetical protein
MRIEVDMNIVKGGYNGIYSTNCKACRTLRMRQIRVAFYREEQTGGERRWETREDGRDNICSRSRHSFTETSLSSECQ